MFIQHHRYTRAINHNMFKEYRKIHRLGAEENDGILYGKCYIQEKIDGANTSIWIEDGEMKCASRTRVLTEGFNGFYDYIQSHEGVKKLLADHPTYRLYGEWLVRHTIAYTETAYKQFYLFDIRPSDEEKTPYMDPAEVVEIAKKYGINHAELFAVIENPTVEQIQEYVGKTMLGDKGEGVVIKNFGFLNKFGDPVYAKIVTQEFKEDNSLVFGGNNKHSETYWEQYVVNEYITLARVQKIMNKLQPLVDKRLGMEHTARVIQTVYHDMITEEIWAIQKKVPVLDFKHLSRLATRKAAKMYHDLLLNSVSVAYAQNNNA